MMAVGTEKQEKATMSKKTTFVNLKMGLPQVFVRKTSLTNLQKDIGVSFLADVTVRSADGFEAKFNASLLAAASPLLAKALSDGATSKRCICSSLLSGEETSSNEDGVGDGSVSFQVRRLAEDRTLVVIDCPGSTVRALLSLVSTGDAGSFASPADFEETWRWTQRLEMRGPKKILTCVVCPMSIRPERRQFQHPDELISHVT